MRNSTQYSALTSYAVNHQGSLLQNPNKRTGSPVTLLLTLGLSRTSSAKRRHKRMHLTLKKEASRPAGANILQQQVKFEAFLEKFNHRRPHEALAMKCPAEIYSASCRAYGAMPEPSRTTYFRIAPSWSPAADVFARATEIIISASGSPEMPSASKRSTMACS